MNKCQILKLISIKKQDLLLEIILILLEKLFKLEVNMIKINFGKYIKVLIKEKLIIKDTLEKLQMKKLLKLKIL